MECPNCGFENTPGTAVCVRCGSTIDLGAIDVRPPRRARTGLWGWLARRRAAVSGSARRGASLLQRSRARWVVWCLLPGTGQIATGWRRLGWVLLALWLVGVMGAILLVGTAEGWCCYGLALAVHSASLGMILGPFLPRRYVGWARRALAGLLIFLALHYTVYGPVRHLASGWAVPIQLFGVNPNPVLQDGDVVLCQGRFVRPRQFQRGDLVAYTIRRQDEGGFHVMGGRNLDRIIGLPGETVSLHKGRLLINGQPSGLEPLAGLARFPRDLEIHAGEDEYIIMPSLVGYHEYHPQVEVIADMYISASRVRAEDVLGKVTWRLRPPSRFGPLEQAR